MVELLISTKVNSYTGQHLISQVITALFVTPGVHLLLFIVVTQLVKAKTVPTSETRWIRDDLSKPANW